jgi:hypothetical protein
MIQKMPDIHPDSTREASSWLSRSCTYHPPDAAILCSVPGPYIIKEPISVTGYMVWRRQPGAAREVDNCIDYVDLP